MSYFRIARDPLGTAASADQMYDMPTIADKLHGHKEDSESEANGEESKQVTALV